MHITEQVGATCSSIGAVIGWVYLQIANSDEIAFVLPKLWIEVGVTLCVLSCGFIGVIAAVEKWNKYKAKKAEKK